MALDIKKKAKNKAEKHIVGLIFTAAGFLFVVLIIIVSISIASRNRDKNLGTDKKSAKLEEQISKLSDSASTSTVKFFVEGGVTADENHYSVEMTINANSRTIKTLRGYREIIENTATLDNNIDAYATFLKALERNDFTIPREDKSGFGYREACPAENSYRFTLIEGGDKVFDRWHTYCDGKSFGDYGGKVDYIFNLFSDQFPDYSEYTSEISI